MVAIILNFISLCVILAGLYLVYQWIKSAFDGERRWRCTKDGLFNFYFLLLLLLSIEQLAFTIWAHTNDLQALI